MQKTILVHGNDPDGQWRTAGESGMPLVVTGMGETMHPAREQAYDRIDDIVIPDLYYWDDVGERWIDGSRGLCDAARARRRDAARA